MKPQLTSKQWWRSARSLEEELELALVIMLNNAIKTVEGFELSQLLTEDINAVEAAYQADMGAYQPALPVKHHELGQLYTLDLDETCRDIHGQLVDRQWGLIGFAVPCHSSQLLHNLAKRLEDVWPVERKVFRHPVRKLSPSFTDVHTEVQKSILERLGPHWKGDHLFPILISEKFLHPFWDNLSRRVAKESPEAVASYRIVFLLAVDLDPKSRVPAEVFLLKGS